MYKEKKESVEFKIASKDVILNVRRWKGDGPEALLLHGWMDSSCTFQFFVDALEDDWDICALDWRGMGGSPWDADGYYDRADLFVDLKRVMDELYGERKVHVLGHSMGGMLLTQFVAMFPERFKSLVVSEGMGLPDGKLDISVKRLRDHILDVENPKKFVPYNSHEEFARKLIKQNPLIDMDKAMYLSHRLMKAVSEDDPDGPITQVADPRHRISQPYPYRWDWVRKFVERIELETLCLEGGDLPHNHYLGLMGKCIKDRYKCFREASVIKYNESGHMIQWEVPQKMARDVEAYWRRMEKA